MLIIYKLFFIYFLSIIIALLINLFIMSKYKVMAFMPGDDVHIHTHLKCSKFTILRIEVLTIDEPFNDEVNVNFDD